MARWGMVIDLGKCTGCQACTIACKEENNVPHGSPDEQSRRIEIFWHKVITATEGEYPNVSATNIPMPCMHCDDPPCVTVCPAKATYKRDDGIVMQNFRRCIGCKYCIVACPYAARNFNYKEQEEEEYHHQDGAPDRSLRGPWPFPHRIHGVVEKCTFCFHRIELAKREYPDDWEDRIGDEVVPACVEACPAEARVFGDLDAHDSPASQWLANKEFMRLRENMGTSPKVYYIPK